MRKKALSLGLCICALFMFTGCRDRVRTLELSDLKKETVMLRSDGTVQSGAYEKFKESYYDEGELKSFMESQIDQFNEEHEKDSVKLSKFDIKNKVAKAIFTYDDLMAYSEMNQVEAASYTMDEAKEAGVLPEVLNSASDGSRISKDEVLKNESLKVLVIQVKANIILPDSVKYYSNAMLLSIDTLETTGDDVAVIVYK